MRTHLLICSVLASFVLTACASDDSSQVNSPDEGQGNSQECVTPAGLSRSGEVPVGVLLPSGSFERQSYASAQEIADAGLNAVSLGWTFYYDKDGNLVYDFDGSSDDNAKKRWVEQIRCSVIEAKEAGLIVSVWGQFQEANYRGEPMGMPENIQGKVLDQATALIPEVAQVLEELQVEYWSPVSELDKYAGIAGHNESFPAMVEAGKPFFTGVIYSQPNILQRDSFFVQGVEPELGAVDALGISWISYQCEPQQLEAADYFVQAAQDQGVDRIFISELGSTNFADESARPCLETLIDYWNGSGNGVFLLDTPPMREGVATIKGNWQEEVLQELP